MVFIWILKKGTRIKIQFRKDFRDANLKFDEKVIIIIQYTKFTLKILHKNKCLHIVCILKTFTYL